MRKKICLLILQKSVQTVIIGKQKWQVKDQLMLKNKHWTFQQKKKEQQDKSCNILSLACFSSFVLVAFSKRSIHWGGKIFLPMKEKASKSHSSKSTQHELRSRDCITVNGMHRWLLRAKRQNDTWKKELCVGATW